MSSDQILFATLLILSIVSLLTARYVTPPDSNESTDHDQDIDQVLTDYYDQLVDEFMTIKSELDEEMRKMEDVKEKEENFRGIFSGGGQQKYNFDDYEYQSDGPGVVEPSQEEPRVLETTADLNLTTFQAILNGSFDDAMKVQRESDMDENAIIRSKELRLSAIRSTILNLRGGAGERNSTVPSTRQLQEIVENKRDFMPNSSTNSYTEKVQSFYPSCEVPKHTDEDAWINPSLMNLLFDVTYPNAGPGAAISIQLAKLRLYKIAQGNSSDGSGKADGAMTFGVVRHTPPEDDRLLRVSVYWYTRTLKRNRVKRKLMDSHMFNSVKDEWIEFNIRTAVRTWKDFGRNYGLVVTVEDEDGVLLPAQKFIKPMNCSREAATVKPMPSMLLDATKEYLIEHPEANQTQSDGANNTEEVNPFQYPAYQYPQLDVYTVEVPVLEATAYQNKLKNDAALRAAASNYNNTRTVLGRRADEERTNLFNTVGVGVPSSGQNRNNLVPILTKSDVVTLPEDGRMRKELLQMQDSAPRRRHGRRLSLGD